MSKNKTPPHKIAEREKNNKSVIALRQALLNAINNPSDVNQKLIDACSSQDKLAQLEIADLKVYHMSLNTHKGACDRVLDGGYKAVNQLRLRAIDVLEQFKASRQEAKSGTKSYYIQQLSDLREENQKLVDSSVFLASKYNELLHLARRIIDRANEGKLVAENETRLLNQHLAKFDYSRFGNLRIFDGGQQ
ncbi:hypothetical protein ACFL3K_00345 [Pseudomonadota bacterium]